MVAERLCRDGQTIRDGTLDMELCIDRRRFGLGLGGFAVGAMLGTSAQGQEEFYKGKQITIIVGYGTGGGYDVYARVLARHIGKYLPGSPSVVVQNMPGAGSLRA